MNGKRRTPSTEICLSICFGFDSGFAQLPTLGALMIRPCQQVEFAQASTLEPRRRRGWHYFGGSTTVVLHHFSSTKIPMQIF